MNKQGLIMIKKILVLNRKDDRTDYDTADSLVQGLNKINNGKVEYTHCDLEELIFVYDNELNIYGNSSIDIRTYDAIFLSGWFKTKMLEDTALAVSKYAQHYKIPCVNSEALYTRSSTKLSQYVTAALHDINTIPFVFSFNNTAVLGEVKKLGWGMPLIAKGVQASRGKDNYLVNGLKQLEDTLVADNKLRLIVQKFIPNDGDYRIIVMGKKAELVMHRKSSGISHLNNTSQGSTATTVSLSELSSSLLDDVCRITSLLRREVGGVDMIVDKNTGKHYFLEANNMPQLSTGSYVEAKLKILNNYLTKLVSED